MFYNRLCQRSIASLLIVTFSSLTLYPLTAAAQVHDAVEKAGLLTKQKDLGLIGNTKRYINKMAGESTSADSLVGSPDEQMGLLLNDIHEQLKAIVPASALPAAARPASRDGNAATPTQAPALPESVTQNKVARIQTDSSAMDRLYADIDQSFSDTEQQLIEAKLPQEILERHHAAVAQYQSRKAQFQSLSSQLDQATTSKDSGQRKGALEGLGRFMAQYPNAKPHQYTDPNKLPFRTADSKVREPFTSKADFQAGLFAPQAAKTSTGQPGTDAAKQGQAAVVLPTTPNAADLAETEDAQITPAIRDQATQLGNNPVKIYNWVRNNIAFIPSYGSIQGSEMTLQNKRGNAFDTASLLIALYRAAGIPSRYVYGTIEVPTNKVMNWVGGVTKPAAAQSLLGQGGIPNVGIISGGTIKTIRMEHVWVEAYVDYSPSRGAVNKHPTTWVSVDASFKQYQFSKGMDVKSSVQFKSQQVLDRVKQGATVNESEGYVQNLNQANLKAEVASYQNQVKTYVDSQKSNATVGEVFGTQKVVQENFSILAGSLPYKTVSMGNVFQALPQNLRWRFRTNIYAADGIGDGSSPIIEINESTAKLAGKKITLSFAPASTADRDLIDSYLPKGHTDGSLIQESELPSTLPGYLLRMKAELRVDGKVLAQSLDSFTMGSEVKQSNQYFNPAIGSWAGGDDNDVTVGEYNAIGLDLQGVGSSQIKAHQASIDATKLKLIQSQLAPDDPAPLSDLSKDDLTGNLLYTGILSYFVKVDATDAMTARSLGNVVTFRLPSYGRFMTALQTKYWFGIPRNVTFPGVAMDVDYLFSHTEGKNADQGARTGFLRMAGMSGSAAEHEIPETLFANASFAANDPRQPQGVSAVKAIGIAAAQGQKIFQFNQTNRAQHAALLAQLNIDVDARAEIQNGLAIGMEVTVHQNPIIQNGWTGSGYLVLNPNTGAGAYKISGGLNGSALSVVVGALSAVVDSLTTKLRNPNHVNGPLNELSRSRLLNKLGQMTTLLTFVKGVYDIVNSDTLSVGQKILQIGATFLFTAAAMEGAAFLGVFFLNPVTGLIAAVILGIILAYILYMINEAIAETEI